jgi:hypothetical protein
VDCRNPVLIEKDTRWASEESNREVLFPASKCQYKLAFNNIHNIAYSYSFLYPNEMHWFPIEIRCILFGGAIEGTKSWKI